MEKERRNNPLHRGVRHVKAKSREDISDVREYIRDNIDVMVKDKDGI